MDRERADRVLDKPNVVALGKESSGAYIVYLRQSISANDKLDIRMLFPKMATVKFRVSGRIMPAPRPVWSPWSRAPRPVGEDRDG